MSIKLESIQDVMRAKFTPLKLSKEYRPFIGTPPADVQFTMALIGEPGSGKSVFSLKLAKEFARLKLGDVIIACPEEDTRRGNQKKRFPVAGVGSSSTGVKFANVKTYADLQDVLKNNPCKFCFIDSVNTFDVDDKEVAQIQKQFPNVNFIYVVQLTKDRKTFRGFFDWEHNTDIPIRFYCNTDDGTCWAENFKNRMGATDTKLFLYKKSEATLQDGSTSNPKQSKQTKNQIKTFKDFKLAQLKRGKGVC